MAKVIKKKNDLLQKRNRQMMMYLGGYILCLLAGAIAIELGYGGSPSWLVWLFALSSLGGMVMIHVTEGSVGRLSGGVDGEKKALDMLRSSLPDSFCCITNAQIFYENRHNELDLIVAGPSGIYIVEVKNVSGRICGSYSDKVLCQEKKKESKEMRNPVQQVRQHTDILSRYLKAKGIRTWVQGVVLFVNPKASVHITDIPGNGVPIFAVADGGKEDLVKYLTRPVPAPLSQEEIQKIAEMI